jgi:hypothetical protein
MKKAMDICRLSRAELAAPAPALARWLIGKTLGGEHRRSRTRKPRADLVGALTLKRRSRARWPSFSARSRAWGRHDGLS